MSIIDEIYEDNNINQNVNDINEINEKSGLHINNNF
jgi:hypothetical protein